jgi:hypothetical protein
MIKGLKIAMIVWGAVGILAGLAHIFFLSQLAAMSGLEKGPAYMPWLGAEMGVSWIIPCVFVIIAAVRDPLKHIMWVQCAIAVAVLLLAADVYSTIRGFVTFSQVGGSIIMFAVFAVALLALYPWRAKPSSE